MKVKANTKFESIIDKTIGRPRKNGEVFEVSEERAKLLMDHNLILIVEEEPKEEIKEEKPKKKSKKAK